MIKRFMKMCAFILVLCMGIGFQTGEVKAYSLIQNGLYRLQIVDSHMYLGLPHNDIYGGAPLVLWKYARDGSQEWHVKYVGNGAYTIGKIGSNAVLELSKYNNNELSLGYYKGYERQRWLIKRNYNGTYSFLNARFNMALDLNENKRYNGNRFQGYPPNGTRAQQFVLIRLE